RRHAGASVHPRRKPRRSEPIRAETGGLGEKRISVGSYRSRAAEIREDARVIPGSSPRRHPGQATEPGALDLRFRGNDEEEAGERAPHRLSCAYLWWRRKTASRAKGPGPPRTSAARPAR